MKRVYKFGLKSLEGVNRTFLGNRTLLPAEPQVSPLGTPCFTIPHGRHGSAAGLQGAGGTLQEWQLPFWSWSPGSHLTPLF